MVSLGSSGLTVSPMGFGCMGITAFYGDSMEDDAAVALLREAYDLGYRHFDSAEMYRTEHKTNEEQIGRFLQTVPRESFTVATKFAPWLHGGKCDLETVMASVDASLQRLGLEYIDLYYCHRAPDTIEAAEEWMRSVKAVVEVGKVKHVGLSEFSGDWLRKLHAIHPVACVQQEWSLLTRVLESTVLPVYKELGIGVVAYSPLARNLLTNPSQAPGDWRSTHPRFSADHFGKNKELMDKVEAMAASKGRTPAQLSLAWLFYQAKKVGVTVVPIPGTTKAKNAADNIAGLGVELSDEEAAQLEELGALVTGARGTPQQLKMALEGNLVKPVAIGSTGLKISPMGFGCMGITAFYGAAMEDDAAVALLQEAHSFGYAHFDTAEVYRTQDKTNEEQIGRFLRNLPRASFTVATKFMPPVHDGKCDLETVAAAVDASLQRLGLDYVDLYYCHRPPPTIEAAEEWMRSMKAVVESGKVKHVGLSEVSGDWLRKMHAIHPVACVQQEWSLLTRSLENLVLPVYKELGIGVVAYSPLARNLLTNPAESPQDWRANHPRYEAENFAKNKELGDKIAAMAESKGLSPAQLSLAWLYYKARKLGVMVVPIPGTTKVQNARDNIAALGVHLGDEEASQLEELGALVAGARGNEQYQQMSIEGNIEKANL